MFLTKLMPHYGRKIKQSVETVSQDQSYLFEFLLILLLLLLVIVGIGWM